MVHLQFCVCMYGLLYGIPVQKAELFTEYTYNPFSLQYLVFSFTSHPPTAQQPLSGPWPPHYRGFMITFRQTTLGRTALDEWSARHRDLWLTTHNTHKRQTSIPPTPSPSGIRTHNHSKRVATDPRLRPRSHWAPAVLPVIKSYLYQWRFVRTLYWHIMINRNRVLSSINRECSYWWDNL